MTLEEILANPPPSFSWPACGIDGNDAVALMPSGMVLNPLMALPGATPAPSATTYFVVEGFASVRCGLSAVPRAPCIAVNTPAAERTMIAVGSRKLPDDIFRHRVDYTYWLNAAEKLTSLAVEIEEPNDNSTVIAAVLNDDNRVADIYISGGIARRTYLVNVTANTTASRIRTDQIRLAVRETV